MTRGVAAQRAIQLAFLAIAGGVWYFITVNGAVSQLFLPSPSAVYAALSRLVGTRQFWSAVEITLYTIVKAYGIAIVLGVLAPAEHLAEATDALTDPA